MKLDTSANFWKASSSLFNKYSLRISQEPSSVPGVWLLSACINGWDNKELLWLKDCALYYREHSPKRYLRGKQKARAMRHWLEVTGKSQSSCFTPQALYRGGHLLTRTLKAQKWLQSTLFWISGSYVYFFHPSKITWSTYT